MPPAAWRRSGWLALPAFAWLNLLLTVESRGPAMWLVASPRLSFELCVAVLAMSAWLAARRGIGPRGQTAWALLASGWVAARVVDVIAPAVFGRRVNLYWDGRHSIELLQLVAADQPLWRVLLVGGSCAAAAMVAGWAVFVSARWAVARLTSALAWLVAHPRGRTALWLVGVGLVGSFAAYPYVGRDTRWFFSLPVAPSVVRHVALLGRVVPGAPQRVTHLTPSPHFDTDLAQLGGADVLLVFAEAYGVTTLDDPLQAAALAAPRAALLQALHDSGRGVVSARVRSPTFGGGSWLAHAALLAGVDTGDPGDYDALLTSDRATLVSHFKRHGYRTVAWMPGLQRPWPEGRYYGFDRVAGADAIGYLGPAFGYWRIPDQASMALLDQQELQRPTALPGAAPATTPAAARVAARVAAIAASTDRPRTPRFIVFPTVSSHVPFRPLAPYLADWNQALQPDAYTADQVRAALAQPVSWTAPRPAYLQSIAYTHQWLSAYLRGRAPADLLTIVIGDHQPVSTVTGIDSASASWDVPVHLISSDRALLQRFSAAGFTAGLLPPAAASAPASASSFASAGVGAPPIGDMHQLTAVLLSGFNRNAR